VGSALLPGERLSWRHIVGALMGLAGTALILMRGAEGGFGGGSLLGYGAAILCALTWSGYSLMSRRFGETPTDVITGFCLLAAILSVVCHMMLEKTVWPETTAQWLAVVGLGLGPVGISFFAWDHGVKKGAIQVLGVASYAAPLLSTLILIVFGYGKASITIALACLLITGGAFLAAYDMLRGRQKL
jgi:drug/metabolite transporter (DMT)-like permease